jgi:methyl-accepting chemotaxis protein
MKKNIRSLFNNYKLIHTLHLTTVLGCVINTMVNLTVGNVLITIVISITYALFIYSRTLQGATTNSKSNSEEENTEVAAPPESMEFDAIQDVASAMKSKVMVIPVLTEQLKAVITQTDSAAEGLIAAFFGINRQSKKQLQSVNELFGNLSEQSVGNSLNETQQKLQELQQNFSAMTSFLDKSIGMIENVVSQLSRVDEFASKIQKIGQMTNILAINASIEAAHSGSAGNGFKVIASEINVLSRDSTESIKEITDITKSLTSNIISIKKELESVHNDTMEIGKRTDSLFGVALKQIDETLQNATEKIRTIAGNAEELNKEIGKAVVSIQFQDITRQRLEHVISPLESLQNEVNGIIQVIVNEGNGTLHTPLHSSDSDLMQQYTMESEREILRNIQNKSS